MSGRQVRVDDDPRAGLLRPRFRLRSLLLGVALLCSFLALAKVLSLLTVWLVGLIFLCVVAHVAGNAIGTHLRDRGNASSLSTATPGTQKTTGILFAPTTGLSQRRSLGFVVLIFVVLGAVFGGGFGGWLLMRTLESKATWANLALGTAAFGVLGGFVGFGASTFLKVVIGANVEAWDDPPPIFPLPRPDSPLSRPDGESPRGP